MKFCFFLTILKQAFVCVSKFWMSASRIWLFDDNFVAWKMQFGSLKVLEKCLNFVLWVCYKPCCQCCDKAWLWLSECLQTLPVFYRSQLHSTATPILERCITFNPGSTAVHCMHAHCKHCTTDRNILPYQSSVVHHGTVDFLPYKVPWLNLFRIFFYMTANRFAGPYVWCSLPEHIRQWTSVAVFKRSLKTFLLHQISHLAH